MKTLKKENNISFEEALKMPELAQLHEAIHFLEKTPACEVFPRQYEAALEHVVYRDIQMLFQENPAMPLKEVLTTILQKLSKELTPRLLLKITQFIIEKWEKLSATCAKHGEMQLASC